MATLLTFPTYTAIFATISLLGDNWRLVAWKCGQPVGHIEYPTIAEALMTCYGWGMTLAGDEMRRVFEEDVILAS